MFFMNRNKYSFIFLLLFLNTLYSQTININLPKENPVNNSKDVLIFLHYQVDRNKLDILLQGYHGLTNSQENINNQDYSEPYHNKHLKWLTSKSREAHPILLYEEAVEIIANAKPLKWQDYAKAKGLTLITRSRTSQDALCYNDPDIQNAEAFLRKVYLDILANQKLIDKTTIQKLIALHKDEINRMERDLVKSYFQPIAGGNVTLPPPDWLKHHSISDQETNLSSSECDRKRVEYALTVIDQLDKQYSITKNEYIWN